MSTSRGCPGVHQVYSRRCPGVHFVDGSRCPGGFQEGSRRLPGGVQEASRRGPGGFQEASGCPLSLHQLSTRLSAQPSSPAKARHSAVHLVYTSCPPGLQLGSQAQPATPKGRARQPPIAAGSIQQAKRQGTAANTHHRQQHGSPATLTRVRAAVQCYCLWWVLAAVQCPAFLPASYLPTAMGGCCAVPCLFACYILAYCSG